MYVSERGILKKVKDEGAGFLTSVIEHLHASTSFSFFLSSRFFVWCVFLMGRRGITGRQVSKESTDVLGIHNATRKKLLFCEQLDHQPHAIIN